MAAPGQKSDDRFRARWVCYKCLEDNPRNKSLLDVHCLNRLDAHKRFPESLVWWRSDKNHLEIYDEKSPGRIPPVRPVPFLKYDSGMMFKLCDGQRCWGQRCRYAHSIEERDRWNSRRQFQPKSERYHCKFYITISKMERPCMYDCTYTLETGHYKLNS